MEINEDSYILGYWFASQANDDCWYMMVTKEGNEWKGQYTFRYNKEEDNETFDPFSGKDEKNIYTVNFDGRNTEELVINNINEIFKFIKIKYNNFHDHFLVKGNAEKFMEIAKTKHYLHIKSAD